MKERFNRNNVVALIEADLARLEKSYGFKYGNGTNVVAGAPNERVLAFGRYDAFRDMLEEFRERS